MKIKIEIIRSETWIGDDFKEIHSILEETLDVFLNEGDEVVNIEAKTRNGQSRFWIYVKLA